MSCTWELRGLSQPHGPCVPPSVLEAGDKEPYPEEDKEASKKILLTVEEMDHETTHMAGPCNPGGG